MAPPIDLKSLIGQPQTPELTATIQSQLIATLDPALNAADPSSITADSVASDIDKLYTSEYSSDEKAEEFIYTLWALYINVVKQIAVDDPRLPLLADVIVSLKDKSSGTAQIWRETTQVWEDLPLLGSCMREAWNSEPKYDSSDKDNATIRSWLTLNSFAARLLGASSATWTNFAIWSLRSSLEEDSLESQVAWDTAIAVAYEWVVHAGKVLLEKSREDEELSQVDKRALAAGKLFGGEPGLNQGRWTFWRQRLETLAEGTQASDTVKDKARKATEKMKALEK